MEDAIKEYYSILASLSISEGLYSEGSKNLTDVDSIIR